MLNLVSKQDFKHFSKICLLRFAAIAFYNTLYIIYNKLMSKHVIYDIGTEILCKTCFGHNSMQNERTSTIVGWIFIEFCVDSKFSIKTRFEALLRIWPSAQKAPAGRLSSPKLLKTVFHDAYFGFDICNPNIFASKNRLRTVPSLQTLYLIQFLTSPI